MKSTIAVLLVAVGLCAFVALSVAADAITGLAPADAALVAGSTFTCRDKSKKIQIAQVNDEFCDCQDGSDEPGTSACLNGQFFCTNGGYLPKTLFSSRVNDGICDCCDGTDEDGSVTKCEDNCSVLGEDLMRQRSELLTKIEAGLAVRQERIASAASIIAERAARLEELEAEIQAQKDLLAVVQLKKDEAEANEKEEQTRLGEEAAAAAAAAAPPAAAADTATTADAGKGGSAGSGCFTWTGDETVEELTAGRQALRQAIRSLDAVIAKKKAAVDTADFDVDETGSEDEDEDDEGVAPAAPTAAPTHVYKDPEAEKLREEHSSATRKLSELENSLKSLQEKVAVDFGPNKEYLVLQDAACISMEDRQYTYTVCPFREVNQGGTRLGKFTRWVEDSDGVNRYRKMMYEHGERCWNGPERSTEVTLKCGQEDRVTSVDEPARCEYAMVLETPSACTREELEGLKIPGYVAPSTEKLDL